MINLDNIKIDEFLALEMVSSEELSALKKISSTDHEVARAVGVKEQLAVSYCMSKESLPSLESLCLFSRMLNLPTEQNEEPHIIDAIRRNHQDFLDLTMHEDGTVKESVEWAFRMNQGSARQKNRPVSF